MTEEELKRRIAEARMIADMHDNPVDRAIWVHTIDDMQIELQQMQRLTDEHDVSDFAHDLREELAGRK